MADKMKTFVLGLFVLAVVSCGRKPVFPVEKVIENRIDKVMYLFTTPVRFYHSFLWWDTNTSEIIFKDISGTVLRYDARLRKYIEVPNLQSIRFVVDSLSANYIRDSLKLLPSDLNYVDDSVQDDGTGVIWMATYDNGELYEGYYNGFGATENHARLVRYLIDLTRKHHPDSLARDYLSGLQKHISTTP